MTTTATWLEDFLRAQELSQPDGRALYAYRCTLDEFETLTEALRQVPQQTIDPSSVRAFVLYASEWWRRKYDGGRWAWQPLLESIDWQVDYVDIYDPIRAAWRWWRIQPVRLPSSTRFLGTFACHGGLPLALLGDRHSTVTRYLRSVLAHVQDYGRFVDDTIELATDKAYLLRPPTLRRDYVFRLAADLVAAVLDLQPAAQGDNPIAVLDRSRPDWRENMPLDLENQVARNLLTILFRDALPSGTARPSDFRLERFLRRTSDGWRLGASVRLPASIGADDLAKHLGVTTTNLGPWIEVRVQGVGEQVAGVYGRVPQSNDVDEYRLADRRVSLEMWDGEAAGEIRLRFLAGDYIGTGVVPARGAMLGELPWAFRADEHECPFVGEGTVRNRATEIIVLAPPHAGKPPDHVVVEGHALGRPVWHTTLPIKLETSSGPCVIHPATAEQPNQEYRFGGERWYRMTSEFPLFRGVPTLQASKSDGLPKAVPAPEVGWRQTGGPWCPRPVGYGLWQVRHMADGELQFHGRVGILPEAFSMELAPGESVSEGGLSLACAERVRVTTESEVTLKASNSTNRVDVAVRAIDPNRPPGMLLLRLQWPGSAELPVETPFPGRGGRFLRQGETVQDVVSLGELYGVRAVAFDPMPSTNFWLEGELKAVDLGQLIKVAHFRRPLRSDGTQHMLPLVEVRPLIEFLLSASSDLHASVVLQIVDTAGMSQAALQVSRFTTLLEYDTRDAFVTLSPGRPPDELAFEALPITRPADDAVPLEMAGTSVVYLPACVPGKEPWLVVDRAEGTSICPLVISKPTTRHGAPQECPGASLGAASCVLDGDSRRAAIGSALDQMVDDEDEVGEVADNWNFLTNMLLRTEGVPAAAIDVITALTRHPSLLVRCLFRLESASRRLLWRIEDELPFSWLLVKRDIWWREAKRAFHDNREMLEKVLPGDGDEASRTAREYVQSVLKEGTSQNNGMLSVATDVSVRLGGGQLSQAYADAQKKEEDGRASEQIKVRNNLDDWPDGDRRSGWIEELGSHRKKLLEVLCRADVLGHQQPIFDTPVAAALLSILPEQPTPRAVFMVKRMRTHDPDWFDHAYASAWTRLALTVDGLPQQASK